jgi:hypothetical protein
VYADHLEWWTYHPGHVVGKAARGYFVFDERSRQIDYFASEAAMAAALRTRGMGAATSMRLTPEDGWRETWAPVFRQACERMKAAGSPAGVDAATHQRMQAICASPPR